MAGDSKALHNELDVKVSRIRQLLDEKRLDAMLLQRLSSFAWATCGSDAHINTAASDGAAALLVTQREKLVFTNNIEACRLSKEEGLAAQGWEFKVSPWYENGSCLADFTRSMNLGTDGLNTCGIDLSTELAYLRSQLTENEVKRFKALGTLCAQSMEEAILAVRPGMNEFQISALLAQAAESRGVQAVVNLVGTDERIFQYRHPIPTSKELKHYAMLILCGRKWGLICSITRLVHFEPVPDDVQKKARAVAQIDAAMIAATRPGQTLESVFIQAEQAYRQNGFPEEWQKHHQGGLAGYEPREITATPTTKQPVLINQAFAWNPTISGAKSEDTILVGPKANEILTEITDWPVVDVKVGKDIVKRPAILERNQG